MPVILKEFHPATVGGEDQWTFVGTKGSAWEDAMTWNMLWGKEATPTTLALKIVATSATRSTVTVANDTITVIFDLTAASSTTSLAAGTYYITIEYVDSDTHEHYATQCRGTIQMVDPYGGG